ncbi:Transposable element Tcb2 transposase, partial [Stegodyphus mimosarum]
MLDYSTPLDVFDRGSVTGVRYRDEVLEPYVRLFLGAMGPEFILQDDNARPHKALLVDEFLESEDIRRMDWLARSPDLSPIQHVWDTLRRMFSQGQPTATMSTDDRYLALCARRNGTAIPTLLISSLPTATGRLGSMSTVRRRLHEGGLYARGPAICVPLTPRHRRDRLQWARQHLHWTPDQWRAVLFTDESKFSLESDSRRYLIWREPETRYHRSNIRESDAYGRGSVCVWSGISLGHLHVFPRGTVNAPVYRDDILDAYVRPYAGQ